MIGQKPIPKWKFLLFLLIIPIILSCIVIHEEIHFIIDVNQEGIEMISIHILDKESFENGYWGFVDYDYDDSMYSKSEMAEFSFRSEVCAYGMSYFIFGLGFFLILIAVFGWKNKEKRNV